MKILKTKVQKTYLYYLLILLSVITLSACSRSPLPVESYQAKETSQASTAEETSAKVQAEFDDFTGAIFADELSGSPLSLHCIVRNPENYGIVVPTMTLGEFSESYLKTSIEKIKNNKARLKSFDTACLTSDQLFTYNELLDYLDTELTSSGLELYCQPLSAVIGIQSQLPILFAEYTFYEKKDVENYLSLLSNIDVYYKQLADFEKAKADAGLAPSDTTLDRMIQSCKDYMIRPENSFLIETFNNKLEDISNLTDEEKNEFKKQHLTILKEHFIPAYSNLSAELEFLKGRGTNKNGLFYYEDGQKYYEYLVDSLTGTDSSVPELTQRIEKQLNEDMAEITLLSQNNPELISQMSSYEFALSKPMESLEDLKEQSKQDFPELPNSTFAVKHVPKALESSLSPAFFLVPPIDDYNKGTIYINGSNEQTDSKIYTTLAHEGYPGHLYQSLYFAQKNSCPLRHILVCNGYAEGWGTYAELYAYSFDNGLSEDLQKLLTYNQTSTLALYALLDIHIHYDGWDLAKTTDFLMRYYHIDDPEVVKEMFEAIIDNPCNYLTYYTGYLEILSMKKVAEDTLGNRYTPKAFHKFILDMEGASFRVIEPYFRTWLLTYDLIE